MGQKSYRVCKVFLAVCFLVILFLFALNGRYIHLSGPYLFDKWKREIIVSAINENRTETITTDNVTVETTVKRKTGTSPASDEDMEEDMEEYPDENEDDF